MLAAVAVSVVVGRRYAGGGGGYTAGGGCGCGGGGVLCRQHLLMGGAFARLFVLKFWAQPGGGTLHVGFPTELLSY